MLTNLAKFNFNYNGIVISHVYQIKMLLKIVYGFPERVDVRQAAGFKK
jgi:hypothetical protein